MVPGECGSTEEMKTWILSQRRFPYLETCEVEQNDSQPKQAKFWCSDAHRSFVQQKKTEFEVQVSYTLGVQAKYWKHSEPFKAETTLKEVLAKFLKSSKVVGVSGMALNRPPRTELNHECELVHLVEKDEDGYFVVKLQALNDQKEQDNVHAPSSPISTSFPIHVFLSIHAGDRHNGAVEVHRKITDMRLKGLQNKINLFYDDGVMDPTTYCEYTKKDMHVLHLVAHNDGGDNFFSVLEKGMICIFFSNLRKSHQFERRQRGKTV